MLFFTARSLTFVLFRYFLFTNVNVLVFNTTEQDGSIAQLLKETLFSYCR